MQEHSTSRDSILYQLWELITGELYSEKACIYLFGSWARQEERQSSDIDIAIETDRPLDLWKWNDLIEKIEASTIPYKVDVVDLQHTNPKLAEKVKEEGILWNDCTSG